MTLNYTQLRDAFQTGNVPGIDNVDGYRTDYGEDRRYRDWNGLCGAVAAWVTRFAGGFREGADYSTAWRVWQQSPTGGTDLYSAPVGSFLFWNVGTDGHVAFKVTPDAMMHGYTDVDTEWWGTNLGVVSIANFQARHGWTFAGWSMQYGPSTAPYSNEDPLPAGSVRKWNPPGAPANVRSGPFIGDNVVSQIAGGDYGDFNAFCYGENVSGNSVWLRGTYSGNWAWAGSFTDTTAEGLPEVPNPVAPAPEPEVPEERIPSPGEALINPTYEDFAVSFPWIRFEIATDPDEAQNIEAKNDADYDYYLARYNQDWRYNPIESCAHWWGERGAYTHDGVVESMARTPDLSTDFVTSAGRVTFTGNLKTASYTTGPRSMYQWTSENDPLLTDEGYITMAAMYYVVELLNPSLRGAPIRLHKEFSATACSDIDPVRLRTLIEEFFDGTRDKATGKLVGEGPAPEPKPEPEPEPEPEKPPVIVRPEDLKDTTPIVYPDAIMGPVGRNAVYVVNWIAGGLLTVASAVFVAWNSLDTSVHIPVWLVLANTAYVAVQSAFIAPMTKANVYVPGKS